MTQQELLEIQKYCDGILDALDPSMFAKKSAVNWGDLRCTQVKYWVDELGASGVEVTIQEADPINKTFIAHIYAELKNKYPFEIDVCCEW